MADIQILIRERLIRRLRQSSVIAFNPAYPAYVARPEMNLVPGVDLVDCRANLD